MSFTRQLSEMSASELNDAIDDTNFPQAHVLSRGRNNSICSTSSLSGASSMLDRNLSQTDDMLAAGVGGIGGSTINTITSIADSNTDAVYPTGVVSKINNRPKLVLKTNGIIPENETTEAPITPMTPRTSTTPGTHTYIHKRHGKHD